ncbi:MAG: dephospho-CoA kinase [Bacteroidetes bacterium]|nr:dephospho-CoA kinase [Bacteroidota bacterium]
MSRSTPIQVGVTGGIGTGKSIVCRIFRCLDVPVYNADERARWLTTHDPEIKQELVELLGAEAYLADGTYNRPYVASRVFTDETLLNKLNQIVHPRVRRDTAQWHLRHGSAPYVIREAALMNRAGDHNNLDYVIVVTAPLDLRIARIKSRDSRSEAEIRAIVERQISDEARLELADFVVDNDTHSRLIPQVIRLHELFIQKKKD